MSPDPKPWWQSKGIVGPLVAILALVLSFFGVKIDPATQGLIVDQAIAGLGAAVALLGSIVGIWGRVTASRPIGK
jgi:hypothetical protein